MANKPKFESFVSPKGIARYPKVVTPDTKFKADGEYSIKTVINGEYCQDLCDQLTALRLKLYQEFLTTEKKTAKQVKLGNLPWKEVTNDQGEATGELEFNFKLPAKVTKKDGTVMEFRPIIFDAKGVPIVGKAREDLRLGGGSTVRVSFEVRPYYTALVGFGIKLSLKAVQIIKLVEWVGGGGNSESYGFAVEEDGFESTPVTTDEAEPVAATAGEASHGKASDF